MLAKSAHFILESKQMQFWLWNGKIKLYPLFIMSISQATAVWSLQAHREDLGLSGDSEHSRP